MSEPGAGAPASTANAYITAAEEKEAEEAEGAETEELEEAEKIEEAEEGEAEAAEEEAEAEEATRHHRLLHDSRTISGPADGVGPRATVSSLALSAPTKDALAHGAPTASKVGFSFALDSHATVHFTLARAIGKSHWQTVSSISVAASRGTDHEHFYGSSKLASGQYRLTLTPTGGRAAQLAFAVR